MRVSIVSHSYTAAENQKNVAALAALAAVQVVLPRASRDRIFREIALSGSAADGRTYRPSRRLGLFGDQYLLLTADMGFRRFAPDIVHVEYDPWSAIFWQAVVARSFFAPRARLVCTVKNNTYRRYPGPLGAVKDAIARAGVRRVDRFVAASRRVADLYREHFGVEAGRLTVMHHLGVDTALFAPGTPRSSDSAPLVVGYVGRFDADKGVRELVQAVRQCRDGRIDLRLEMLGAGSLGGELEARARAEGWLAVRRPVPHHEVAPFLHGLDVFVLPARVSPEHEEHDAHALLEALAAGLPCIGTRSGIIPEILGDGAGLLVEANSVEALRAGLARLAAGPELRRELGSIARERALASFSLEALAERRTDTYREVLDDR